MVISFPRTVIDPEVALSRPPMMLRRVVFPEPEGPIRAIISPSFTVRFSPLTARISMEPIL